MDWNDVIKISYRYGGVWCAVVAVTLGTAGCQQFSRPSLTSTSLAELPANRMTGPPVAHPPLDHDAKDGYRLQDFNVDNLNKQIKKAAGQAPNPEIARAHYEEAEAEYRQASAIAADDPKKQSTFKKAADGFQKAAGRFPGSQLEEDALFLAAESLFFADKYAVAADNYENLLAKYPNSKYLDKIEARRFEIARYWLKEDENRRQQLYEVNLTDGTMPWRDRFGNAVRIFERIRFDDPTGDLADDATMAEANAFFVRGNYLRADELYSDLRETFPASEHQFNAHLFAVESKMKYYQGPDYSGDALEQAEKLIIKMKRQFPQQFQENVEFLGRTYNEVRQMKAEREMFMAKFFAARGHNKSARFYYQSIVDDYQDVPSMVDAATAKLTALAGKPDSPPERWKWLDDYLPNSRAEEPLILSNPAATFKP